ncbi:bcl-2-like protein 11 [Nerophis lumbriciformis]|uniref:bcl-2-like protein 11 n=1 Tax=Nerophis lumbriciformis TaxID=546530 RepID=UPI002ADF22EF|nr:bcl-2-like protein 11 [Nerophis lumbriciformis]
MFTQSCVTSDMHSTPRAHGSAVTTQPSAGRPRPKSTESRREQSTGFCSPVAEEEERGGGAGGSTPRSPSRRRCSVASLPPERRGVFETRSIFQFPYRRSSSGYFSLEGDSLPASPLSPRAPTATRATQTPSPCAQVVEHALLRVAEDQAGAMQAVEIGRELRRIGDDYNDYILRGAAGRRVVIHQNQLLPHIHQEPAILLCMGLLFFLIGRYLHGIANGQPDQSAV